MKSTPPPADAVPPVWRDYFIKLVREAPRFAGPRRFLQRDLVETMQRLIPRDAKVLEVGVGGGTLLAGLPNVDRHGLDILPEAIEQARKFSLPTASRWPTRSHSSPPRDTTPSSAESALSHGSRRAALARQLGGASCAGRSHFSHVFQFLVVAPPEPRRQARARRTLTEAKSRKVIYTISSSSPGSKRFARKIAWSSRPRIRDFEGRQPLRVIPRAAHFSPRCTGCIRFVAAKRRALNPK